MDTQSFLGMQPINDDLHWRMRVEPHLATPDFLFGGCGLGAALVALEKASGRATVWATAQYLSYAATHSEMEWEVTLAATGRHVTQGRAVGVVGRREILTVNAALGEYRSSPNGTWVEPPQVPPPEECPPRYLPDMMRNTIIDTIDSRTAKGRPLDELDGKPGLPNCGPLGPSPGPSRDVGGHVGHLRGLRRGRRIGPARRARHEPQSRQHASSRAAQADRLGALRHQDARRLWRLRAGGGPLVVARWSPLGDRKPIIRRAPLARTWSRSGRKPIGRGVASCSFWGYSSVG